MKPQETRGIILIRELVSYKGYNIQVHFKGEWGTAASPKQNLFIPIKPRKLMRRKVKNLNKLQHSE